MRRSDREITAFEEIVDIIEKCDVCRLALNDEEYPYILPLNFGMQVEGEEITLYFHGANHGTKYEIMKKDSRASFEMDCMHKLVMDEETGNCTMEYKSVVGHGQIEIVPEEEKYDALCILMRHYHQEEFPFNQRVIPYTIVFKLKVKSWTGKKRMKKPETNN